MQFTLRAFGAAVVFLGIGQFGAVAMAGDGIENPPASLPLEQAIIQYPNAILGVDLGPDKPSDSHDRGIDDPDAVEMNMKNRPLQEHAYYVSCSINSAYRYKRPFLEPDLDGDTVDLTITPNTSVLVSAFLTVSGVQYIYGTLVTQRGFTTGQKYYMPAFEWDCGIYQNWM